jgi:hypothetical protein
MSGDSDFSSLVLKLKEYGKYVIGVGIQESSSDLLVQNCDEYYSYSALSGLSKTSDQVTESHDPWQLAAKAVDKMVDRGDTMRSDRLKQVMLEIDPSFDEREHGYNKFNRFVVQAASKGLLSIQKMENGQYGVAPGDKGGKAKESKQESKAPRASRAGGRRERERGGEKERGKTRERSVEPDSEEKEAEGQPPRDTQRARPKLTMSAALRLLEKALDVLLEGGTGTVRDSDVKRRMLELDPSFDEGELGYSKFSKFLQAAEERGAIDLERGPNGNYHVGRPSKTKQRPSPSGDTEALSNGESTMKRLARFFFGSAKPEAEGEQASAGAGLTQPEATPPEATPPERPAETRGEARLEKRERVDRGGGGPRDRRGKRSPRDATSVREPSSRPRRETQGSEARQEPTRGGRGTGSGSRSPSERRGRGRREREERARPPVEKAEATVPPEVSAAEKPVQDEPIKAAGEEAPEGVAAGAVEAPLPGAPRGTIRGRWGTRGRYRPAPAPPPLFDGQTGRGAAKAGEKTSEADAERPAVAAEPAPAVSEAEAVVAQLTAYPGVGRVTAQTLVDAFGTETLRVLDEEPERVRGVLPDHRADRVLEARREERAAGGQ